MTHHTQFIVQTSAAKMPSSCKGRYRNVAVLEVLEGIEHVAMISDRARGVVRIVSYEGKLHAGRSGGPGTAYGKALARAEALAARMNAEKGSIIGRG